MTNLAILHPEKRQLHDIELEQAILGACLFKAVNIDRLDGISPDDFFDPIHAALFRAMRDKHRKGEPVDAITLKSTVEGLPDISEGLTVKAYLGRLLAAASVSDVAPYGQVLRVLSTRRKLEALAEDIAKEAADESNLVELVIEKAESELYGLKHQGPNAKAVVSINEAMEEAIDIAAKKYERGSGLGGLPTGIKAADDVIGGMSGGGLYVLAGRPGMGKTAFAVNVGVNVALGGFSVGFMSLEMGGAEIGARVLSQLSEVPGWAIRKGDIRSDDQWKAMVNVAKEKLPFYVDTTGGLTCAQMVTRARRLHRKYGIDLLIIDYLQLVSGSANKGGNRVQEVTEITNALKGLAKELNIPVMALSQLNRAVESRDNKRPQLSDLRESGSIEQDADAVLFTYRESYYLEREKPEETSAAFADWQTRMMNAEGKAELICAKNRHGPVGVADLKFNADTTTFS